MKKLIIPILVFTTGLNLFSQSNIENQIFDIGIESIESFREFLSIKNDANFKNEMKPLIEWGINNFKKYGFEVERLETPELPLLLASKVISEDLTTILIYLQFDGQPVDNSKWDQESPYKAVLKEKNDNEYKIIDWSRLDNITFDDIKKEDLRIFARSASDAKGPVMMILNALEIMKRNNLTADDVAWLVPHQANKRIIDATARRMGVGDDKVMLNIHKFGNTTSGTIPLLLWDYEKQLKKGDNIIISAFGGGFTWGSIFLKWAY